MGNDARETICRKFAAPYKAVDAHEIIAVAIQTVGLDPVHGVRVARNASDDAEWFIYCGEFSPEADFYQPIHASHLKDHLPFADKYLGLGIGYRFIIDANGYEDVWFQPS